LISSQAAGKVPLPPAAEYQWWYQFYFATDRGEDGYDNYRWRQDLADGERQYDDLEAQLAASPTIGVPTISLEGDANGAPHADPSTYASKYTGKYEHRDLTGGIGHNLP
jgi:hypothetical protein